MAHNTFECVDHISSETLSAWRDDHLPPAELARLGPHVAICAACQARLAGFDEVARALLRQRNLDPGDRILDGVRRRAAQRPQRGRLLHGRVWGELGALGSVAAVLILFIYVVAVLGVGRGHPIGPAGPKRR